MELGEQIKSLRRTARLTQKELAERSGLSYSYVTKLENGYQRNPTRQILQSLGDALGANLLAVHAPDDFLALHDIPGLDSALHDFADPRTQRLLETINYADCLTDEGQTKGLEYVKDLYSSEKYRLKEVRRRKEE